MIRYFCKISDLNAWSNELPKQKRKSVSLSVLRYHLLKAFSLMDRYENVETVHAPSLQGKKKMLFFVLLHHHAFGDYMSVAGNTHEVDAVG